MTISKLKSEWAYVLGRLAALASRPLMLLLANHLVGNALASSLAVVFLVVTLSMAISGFDTHRPFYQSYFGHRPSRGVKRSYETYVSTVALQVGCVAPLLVGYMVYLHQDLALGALVALYFASERLADESQRFLIFQGDRQQWGMRIMTKAILQLLGVFLATLATPSYVPSLAVLALAMGNLLAYGSRVNSAYLPRGLASWRQALEACRRQTLFWLLSGVTALIGYLDRVVVMVFQQSDMAAYTIMVSCMSIIQNAVDYFFVSLRRRDILQDKLGLKDVFLSRRLYGILGVSAVLGGLACWSMLYLYHGKRLEQWELVPIVLVSQTALSITLVVREMIYWNYSVRQLVVLESAFIGCALVAAALTRFAGLGYEVILGVLAVLFLVRLTLMALVMPRSASSKLV